MATDINPTTKRFARSTAEAFGLNASEAIAIEHHRCRTTYYATWLMRAIVALSAVGIFWSLT